jgi:filamentous hemagglutinin
MADVKNFGLIGIGSSVQYGKNGGSLTYSAGTFDFDQFGGSDGNVTLGSLVASGDVSFATLTDAGNSITIENFVNAAAGLANNDNDITIPTSAAIIDYVDSQFTAGDLDFQADTGGALNVDLDSQIFGVLGGTNINTAGAGTNVTINLDESISLGNVTATGTITGGTLTDGTLTITNGTITGVSGNIDTTGSINVTGGGNINVDGAVNAGGGFFTGNTTITGGELIAEDATLSGNVSFGNLVDTGNGITISNFVDEAAGIINNDNDTTIPTTAAIIDYVTAVAGAANLTFQADTGGALTIELDAETFGVLGGNNIVTSGDTNNVTIALADNITVPGNVTASNFITGSGVGGTITGASFIEAGNVQVTDDLAFGSLTDTGESITILKFVDAADGIPNNDDDQSIPTTAAIISYVTGQVTVIGNAVTSANLSINSDSANASATINLGTETLTFNGGTNITTDHDTAGDFITINLDSNLTGLTSVGTGSLTATGTVQFGSLSDGSITIVSFIDDDSMATAAANNIPTAESVKAYIDNQLVSGGLAMDVSDGSNSGNIVFATETLTITGTTNEVDVVYNSGSDTFTIGLPDDVTVAGNLSVSGLLFSNDITAATISIDGDATVTGNLTVSGTTTIVNSTEVEIADAILRVNSDGTIIDAGIEANINGDFKSILYDVTETEWTFGTEDVRTDGTLIFGSLDDGSITITNFVTSITDSDTVVPTAGAVFDYVAQEIGNATANSVLSFKGDAALVGNVTLESETLSILGGTNIDTVVAPNSESLTINLHDALTGLTSVGTGSLTASGTVQFGSLFDGTITIGDFETTLTNDDTKVPTSGAVYDYVTTGAAAVDNLILRAAIGTGSSEVNIGTMPNVSGRTYYADKIVLNVTTPFSGGSFDHILVRENSGAGTTLVAADDADGSVVGTYIVDLTGSETLTAGQSVEIQFKQSNGTTASVPTGGAMIATVHYRWV